DKPQVVQGDKATLKVKVVRLWPEIKNPIQVGVIQGQNRQGAELPVNLRINNNQPINIAGNSAEGTLNVQVGADVPPGLYNVVLRGQTQAPFNKDPKAKGGQPVSLVQPSAPVSLFVLPKALATLSVANATVKAGGQVEVVVRVNRLFNYAGELKVALV